MIAVSAPGCCGFDVTGAGVCRPRNAQGWTPASTIRTLADAMMTRDEAQLLALNEIRKHSRKYEFVILDAETMETAYGWIFFYQTRLFVETRNIIYALGGNGPVIVERSNGRVSMLGTGRPLEEMLIEFETEHGLVR